jgi:hypothetical protein
MPIVGHIAIDRHSPILRQKQKIAALQARLFKLHGELKDAEKELARLELLAAGDDLVSR